MERKRVFKKDIAIHLLSTCISWAPSEDHQKTWLHDRRSWQEEVSWGLKYTTDISLHLLPLPQLLLLKKKMRTKKPKNGKVLIPGREPDLMLFKLWRMRFSREVDKSFKTRWQVLCLSQIRKSLNTRDRQVIPSALVSQYWAAGDGCCCLAGAPTVLERPPVTICS